MLSLQLQVGYSENRKTSVFPLEHRYTSAILEER